MNELLTNLASPSWWISVVILSFAINLASAYAKTPLDRLLARFSARRRKRLERVHGEHLALLQAALRQDHGLVLLSIEELKLVVVSITVIVICILLLLLLKSHSNPVGLAIPFVLVIPICLIAAFFGMRRATTISAVLKLNESTQTSSEA